MRADFSIKAGAWRLERDFGTALCFDDFENLQRYVETAATAAERGGNARTGVTWNHDDESPFTVVDVIAYRPYSGDFEVAEWDRVAVPAGDVVTDDADADVARAGHTEELWERWLLRYLRDNGIPSETHTAMVVMAEGARPGEHRSTGDVYIAQHNRPCDGCGAVPTRYDEAAGMEACNACHAEAAADEARWAGAA